jgi:hypothetical protein
MDMVTIERRNWLAGRWRKIASETKATAREWPDIAESLRQLADDIEADRPPHEPSTGANAPRA